MAWPAQAKIAAPLVDESAAAAAALAEQPGEIVQIVTTKTSESVLYRFNIEAEDGSVIEVDVSGQDGSIAGRRVAVVAPKSLLPKPDVREGEARVRAVRYLEEKSAGKKPVVTSTQYMTRHGRPAYKIVLRRGFDEFTVFVDSQTADILSSDETR